MKYHLMKKYHSKDTENCVAGKSVDWRIWPGAREPKHRRCGYHFIPMISWARSISLLRRIRFLRGTRTRLTPQRKSKDREHWTAWGFVNYGGRGGGGGGRES